MAQLTYTAGDATQPTGQGPKVITHVCNDIGKWGRGFVMALSRRWPETRACYLEWFGAPDFQLGMVQFVQVEADLWVANLIGQHGIRRRKGDTPVRYPAIASGLAKVAAFASDHGASVHMPRIGAGLAGGDWNTIEQLILDELVAVGVDTTVYDLS
ncbi:MAG: Appr-1-p processing protein [Myxococcota bacterium]